MNVTPKVIAKSLHGIAEILESAHELSFPDNELNDMTKKSDEIVNIIEARGVINSIESAINK